VTCDRVVISNFLFRGSSLYSFISKQFLFTEYLKSSQHKSAALHSVNSVKHKSSSDQLNKPCRILMLLRFHEVNSRAQILFVYSFILLGHTEGSEKINTPQVFFIISFINGSQYVWPPLWSSGQSSLLQIQKSGFNSRCYQIFWEVVCLERGPLSFVNTTGELLKINSSGSGLESREYGHGDHWRWPRDTLYPQKLELTSLTSGDRSVGTVCSQTKATEFPPPAQYV
jgi:hypothetical protein